MPLAARCLSCSSRRLTNLPRFGAAGGGAWRLPNGTQHGFFTSARNRRDKKKKKRASLPLAIITGGLLIWWLYPSDDFSQLSGTKAGVKRSAGELSQAGDSSAASDGAAEGEDDSAWATFTRRFESITMISDLEWTDLSDKLLDLLPEWSKLVPGYVRKLQRELSMAQGSLADELWQEAHDPLINPEIRYSAEVRVSQDLCSDEKEFLARRRKVIKVALAKYLGLDEKDIHPDDVPTIAMCGSGGGLRALIAGTGSLLASEEDGLFDCATYTAGVSGSCWLQLLYLSSFSRGSIASLLDHLKARASTHIAYPPTAFQALTSLPTSKYLLSGVVERLRGDPKADFGLVDVYGLLLAARYLVPKGDLDVNDRDFKLSNQRAYVKYGQNPMPIYTAVRHEIPGLDDDASAREADKAKETAKRESWFQWFEMTPYEIFCEEFGAGIPTWALGRRFSGGKDVPPEDHFHLPEIRIPLLMGIFGSAFCATLKHYYQEIKPVVRGMSGFKAVDELVSGRNEDLSKVHPIDPASIPNYVYQMQGKLPETAPQSIYDKEYIQLMDAGMSNNLPIYPLLRPGRDVDVVITFDASADVKTDNWLSVVEGYARQRGIKGWPVGIGWPKNGESPEKAAKELKEAQAHTTAEAEQKVQDAKSDSVAHRKEASKGNKANNGRDGSKSKAGDEGAGDLGYCTVWVGTTEERSSSPPPPSKAVTHPESWRLMEPDAGIAVAYLPLLANDRVPGVSPGSSDYLSTWNFVYTPDQIDSVVALARANYAEGREQLRSTVRTVYERKKKLRGEREKRQRVDRLRAVADRGEAALRGEGDQFS